MPCKKGHATRMKEWRVESGKREAYAGHELADFRLGLGLGAN